MKIYFINSILFSVLLVIFTGSCTEAPAGPEEDVISIAFDGISLEDYGSYDFGDVPVYRTNTVSVSVTYNGAGILHITDDIEINGTDADFFMISGDSSVEIAAGSTAEFTLSGYSGSVYGIKTAVLTINSSYESSETFSCNLELNSTRRDWVQAETATSWEGKVLSGCIEFKDKLWVLGDYTDSVFTNNIYFSSDGQTWEQAEVTSSTMWAARYNFGCTVFDDKLWVIGGQNADSTTNLNDVWYSETGTDWQEAEQTSRAMWSVRSGLGCVTFDNKLWVIGGSNSAIGAAYNDVWFSSDGSYWTEAVPSSGIIWDERQSFGCSPLNGKIYIAGGMGSFSPGSMATTYFSDVWSSADGITWTRLNADSEWGARAYLMMKQYSAKLWIAGGAGENNTSAHKDLWYSSDGISWYEYDTENHWEARIGQCGTVYKDRLWIMGGYNTEGNMYTDIWYW